MIHGTIKSVFESLASYQEVDQIREFLNRTNWNDLPSGRSEIGPTLYVVKIKGDQPIEMANCLEYHQKWFDLHYTCQGIDVIQAKPLNTCEQELKPYQEDADYGLYSDKPVEIISIPEGNVCFIGPETAHMAMCGTGPLDKLVFKILIPS